MTPDEIKVVYMAASENVRRLGQYRRELLRDLNRNLIRNESHALELKTKLYALLYSCWSEIQFLQLLHTPDAFRIRDILSVKETKRKDGIGKAWHHMVSIAFNRVGNIALNSDLKGRHDFLVSIIDEYIVSMITIRNKIAHGQWVVALNSSNTAENPTYTAELDSLDYVQIDKRFTVHAYLARILRDLMQSPTRGFHRDYWVNQVQLERTCRTWQSRTLASKKVELEKKIGKTQQQGPPSTPNERP